MNPSDFRKGIAGRERFDGEFIDAKTKSLDF